MQFIVQTLKPYIDARYRTDSTRNGTWIWGSSMGGLISQYGAVKYQEVFSRVGVFSPSLWFDTRIMQQPAAEGYRQNLRFYLMAGALESSSMVPQLNQLRDQLILAGFPASQIQTVVKADGQHSEWFWRREFQDAYNWLKGQNPSTIADDASFNSARHTLPLKMRVIPNPCRDWCEVEWSPLQDRNNLECGLARVTVRDVLGKQWLNGVLPHHKPYLDVQDLPEALYYIIISEGKSTFSGSFIKTNRPIY